MGSLKLSNIGEYLNTKTATLTGTKTTKSKEMTFNILELKFCCRLKISALTTVGNWKLN